MNVITYTMPTYSDIIPYYNIIIGGIRVIVHQPYDKQLGIQLIECMQSNKYSQLTIMVAYAKLSGVYRLTPYIDKFRRNGGEVRIVVGIDQQNTTYDALLQLSKLSDELFIFHSESAAQTFHIKCYWLKGKNESWYAIGSNNLTAGGLFSNYELCITNSVTGDRASSINSELESIYSTYTDLSSVCTHEVDNAFLDQLLRSNYVVREIQQRKYLAEAAKQARVDIPKNKLFRTEVFPAPSLPVEYRKVKVSKEKKDSTVQPETKQVQRLAPSAVDKYQNNYLIRLVPRAGDRSKQVHFTVDLLENFFCLSPGDGILVQEMFSNGEVGEIEQRQVVFSERNRNVKIELAGAAILDTNYPENPDTRPILILKRVNNNLFVYMIIMEGDDGYSTINSRLRSLPTGRSLPYEVIDENTMLSLWDNCPIT